MATKRTWTIGAYEGEDGLPHADQDKLAELLSDLMGTLRSVGGQFIVAAQRMEREPGSDEGLTVGCTLGLPEGCELGWVDGDPVGCMDGATIGCLDG